MKGGVCFAYTLGEFVGGPSVRFQSFLKQLAEIEYVGLYILDY